MRLIWPLKLIIYHLNFYYRLHVTRNEKILFWIDLKMRWSHSTGNSMYHSFHSYKIPRIFISSNCMVQKVFEREEGWQHHTKRSSCAFECRTQWSAKRVLILVDEFLFFLFVGNKFLTMSLHESFDCLCGKWKFLCTENYRWKSPSRPLLIVQRCNVCYQRSNTEIILVFSSVNSFLYWCTIVSVFT